MARPRQDGLLYFSFDTDFFYADQRIKRLHSRYGSDGMLFYIYLLTEIYRNGYYIRWDGESVENAMDDLHITEGLIEQVMTFLVSRSLLCKSTLANSDTVITSPGIQKRYQEAVKSRKRDVCVNAEIWLLKKTETAPFIKVTQNENKSCGNDSFRVGNESKSCGNGLKESKGKESKGKEIPRAERFEEFWAAYPNKQRRYLAENAYCDLVLSGTVTEDNLVEAAKSYAAHIGKTGDKAYMPNNFLGKCVFEDYLPENRTVPGHEDSVPEEDSKDRDGETEELAGDDWMDY